MPQAYWVSFSKLQQALGFPATVKLTKPQAVAVARLHLGGLEALRTPSHKTASRTVESLVELGLLSSDGPTDLGKQVGEAVHEEFGLV